MNHTPYTLAMYRAKTGREDDLIAAWRDLIETFAALPRRPRWATLIRSKQDPSVFYGFGPWESLSDIQEMRSDAAAQKGFERLAAACEEMTPAAYDLVEHIVVSQD